MKSYTRLKESPSVSQHHGIFHKQLSLWEGVGLIVSGTVGAGVLAIPFAIAKVGAALGVLYIVSVGVLMIGLNLLVGELAIKTGRPLQLAGLAKEYLGEVGELFMTLVVYLMLYGALIAYIVGVGETLHALMPDLTSRMWSLVFFGVASALVFIGLRTIKVVELILSLGILFVVLLIALISAPHIEMANYGYSSIANMLLPYGVLLFAFQGATTIPEVYSVLKDKEKTFKKSIITAGVLVIVVYVVFAVTTIGVSGSDVTEIATIGLGNQLGRSIFVLGNIFAILAMGTGFIMAALAMRDSMHWDFNVDKSVASTITCLFPCIFFLLGINQFIAIIDVVGGILMSIMSILILIIYWKAKKKECGDSPMMCGHNIMLLIAGLMVAMGFGALYSVIRLFQ